MTTLYIVLGLVAVAAIPYFAWTWFESRKQRRVKTVHAEVLSMGDEVTPPSLHPEIDLNACIGSSACIRACPEGEILGLTDGRARLVNPLACVGHSACMQACPVGAIKLVFGTATRGLELPMLTPHFETNQRGIYIIGELSGMGLIRNATMQGNQLGATIAKSGRRGGAGDPDVLIVGAGPAGISAALACIAHGLSVQIVEQSVYGGTIAHFPRKRIVMTGALELPGFGTIRKRSLMKEELLDIWGNIRQRANLDVREATRVDSIERVGDLWRVVNASGFSAKAPSLVLALGRRGAPRLLEVPGEDLHKVAYRLLEPDPFAGKHVMVVGGGNAAADCVIALAESQMPRSVSISYRRMHFARMRDGAREKMERLIADDVITAYLGSEITRIGPSHVTLQRADGFVDVANDGVIIQIGGTSPTELLRTVGIQIVEKRGEA